MDPEEEVSSRGRFEVTTLVAQPLTLGSLAVFVVFWLQNRSHR